LPLVGNDLRQFFKTFPASTTPKDERADTDEDLGKNVAARHTSVAARAFASTAPKPIRIPVINASTVPNPPGV